MGRRVKTEVKADNHLRLMKTLNVDLRQVLIHKIFRMKQYLMSWIDRKVHGNDSKKTSTEYTMR